MGGHAPIQHGGRAPFSWTVLLEVISRGLLFLLFLLLQSALSFQLAGAFADELVIDCSGRA